MGSYKAITTCRTGDSDNLISVLDLGFQALTGVFPNPGEEVEEGPIELLWCPDTHLVQLRHSFAPEKMYGDNYGYRSGLNQSMVRHLTNKVAWIKRRVPLAAGDVVLDIGSNDATTLKAYDDPSLTRIGIDPTGAKFHQYYPQDVALVPDFFSKEAYFSKMSKPAKVVTSIAMFYDLEDPIAFARDIEAVLDDDGIWHFEQSYLPTMLHTNSFDTMCHEHLEYYSMLSVQRILAAAGMRIIDVSMNDINGGSFAVTAAKAGSTHQANDAMINWMIATEKRLGLETIAPFEAFRERVYRVRDDLVDLVRSLRADGKTVYGYGASTKGNVTLQFCGFTAEDITAIVEVNPDKFGHETPGTHIPIISEEEARQAPPDYYLVLPWHFRNGILAREQDYLQQGGHFIFPMPNVEVV